MCTETEVSELAVAIAEIRAAAACITTTANRLQPKGGNDEVTALLINLHGGLGRIEASLSGLSAKSDAVEVVSPAAQQA